MEYIKNIIKKKLFSLKSIRKPSIAYCVDNELLPSIIVRTPSAKLREQMMLPTASQLTQLNQDIFALLANQFRSGFFLEIGANDGFNLSNTVYLEEHFGWKGILVEANPQYSDSLKNRKTKSVIAAVVKNEGYYRFCNAGLYGGITELLDDKHNNVTKNASSITVFGMTLKKILDENNAPNIINFISIDVEGGEVQIVEQISQLKNYRFTCGCIEHNGRKSDYLLITDLLQESGYRVVWEDQTEQDLFFIDEKGLGGSGAA